MNLSFARVVVPLVALAALACSSSNTTGAPDPGAGDAAADGSSASPDSSTTEGGTTGDAAVLDGGDGGTGKGFIQAEVDGTQVRATAGLRGLVNPGPNIVQLTASTTENISDPSFRSYGVAFVNAVGTYTCGVAPGPTINYAFNANATPTYWTTGTPPAPCTVVVTSAAANVGDYIEGTFTATVKVNGTGAEHTLASGSFSVARTQ